MVSAEMSKATFDDLPNEIRARIMWLRASCEADRMIDNFRDPKKYKKAQLKEYLRNHGVGRGSGTRRYLEGRLCLLMFHHLKYNAHYFWKDDLFRAP